MGLVNISMVAAGLKLGPVVGQDIRGDYTGIVLQQAEATAQPHAVVNLCGHTHDGGEVQVLENLRVVTGPAENGNPEIQRVIEVA